MWASASSIEIAWSVGALIGLMFTTALMVWCFLRFQVVKRSVARGKAVPWGQRWRLLVGLMVTMFFFGLGWVGYLVIGFVAMNAPRPVTEPAQNTANWFAVFFVGMEICHALAQLTLFLTFLSLSGRWVWLIPGAPVLYRLRMR